MSFSSCETVSHELGWSSITSIWPLSVVPTQDKVGPSRPVSVHVSCTRWPKMVPTSKRSSHPTSLSTHFFNYNILSFRSITNLLVPEVWSVTLCTSVLHPLFPPFLLSYLPKTWSHSTFLTKVSSKILSSFSTTSLLPYELYSTTSTSYCLLLT